MKKWMISIAVICLLIGLVFWMGIGPYSSGSAVSDLKGELEKLYGPEYSGLPAENGAADMVFVVTPKTWFLTNWNLRNALGLDYRYECQVVFTTHTKENTKIIRTITYQGIDPMGKDHMTARAYLDLESIAETTEVS